MLVTTETILKHFCNKHCSEIIYEIKKPGTKVPGYIVVCYYIDI